MTFPWCELIKTNVRCTYWPCEFRQTLVEMGILGDPSGGLNACLERAYHDFKTWRRERKVPCSQRRFAERHLLKASHGYYFTAKAYNGRVVLEWLAGLCRKVASDTPENLKLQLHSNALLLISVYVYFLLGECCADNLRFFLQTKAIIRFKP